MATSFYFMGIDLGTSSVKVTITKRLNAEDQSSNNNGSVVCSWQEAYGNQQHSSVADEDYLSSVPTEADDANTVARDLTDEQNATVVINSLLKCLQHTMSLLADVSSNGKLQRIAVCGQMHGVILWNEGLC